MLHQRSRYFHELCADINEKQSSVLRTPMIVMAHLLAGGPTRSRSRISRSRCQAPHPPSSSSLNSPTSLQDPQPAQQRDTLETFTTYVETFVNQHTEPDTKLPNRPPLATPTPLSPSPRSRHRTKGPFAFVALFGHGDSFSSIPDLCRPRGGVFLKKLSSPSGRLPRRIQDPRSTPTSTIFSPHANV
ncbi:hypothetical protein G7Y79_00113g101730 [Physcia stellaris]|nr:hypothetical protein G7Y79_00113g101730 [Physcia stellaris]